MNVNTSYLLEPNIMEISTDVRMTFAGDETSELSEGHQCSFPLLLLSLNAITGYATCLHVACSQAPAGHSHVELMISPPMLLIFNFPAFRLSKKYISYYNFRLFG